MDTPMTTSAVKTWPTSFPTELSSFPTELSSSDDTMPTIGLTMWLYFFTVSSGGTVR